jgi:DNA-binding FrmR family transcriptional regulator
LKDRLEELNDLFIIDTDCDQVINQISATQSALNCVGNLLLAGHLKGCVMDRLQEGSTG